MYFVSTKSVSQIAHNGLRLGEGGGLTKAWAGGELANPYKSLGGHTPPLSLNRLLWAGAIDFTSILV